MICDDSTVQRVLPQVIILSKGLITAGDCREAQENLPQHMYVWHADKCWMTTDLMTRLVKLLSTTLKQHFPEVNIVFSADAYRAHLTKPVWRSMAAARILYCLIPARMTPVLQPCDVAVFAVLKRSLARKIQILEVTRPSGTISTKDLICAVGETVESIIRMKCWKKTFDDCGLVGHQRLVSARVLGKLSLRNPILMPHTLPSLAQLKDIFPARTIIPIDGVFATIRRMMSADAESIPRMTMTRIDSEPHGPEPWSARLRRTRARETRGPPPDTGTETCPMPAPAPMAPPPAPETPRRSANHGHGPVARRLLPPRHSSERATDPRRTDPT